MTQPISVDATASSSAIALADFTGTLTDVDPAVARLLAAEEERNAGAVNLIASESYCPRATLEAEASLLVTKNVYGYPGRRGVSGCGVFDEIEQLAVDRACSLFGARRANVQALSSTIANIAVFRALVPAGRAVLAFDEASGGHHSHGAAYHLSGRDFTIASFGVDEGAGGLDMDALERQLARHRPALVVAGSTSYPRAIDFAALAARAHAHGARFFADIAHVSGLVAAGLHANPVAHADVTTTSTHKTLCGPRTGGLVLSNDAEVADLVDKEIFPGLQGAPGGHIIAGRAALFDIAARPAFRSLMGEVVANARSLAQALTEEGLELYLGGTDTHMVVIDLRHRGEEGTQVEKALEAHGLVSNRVALPPMPGAASRTGIRVGTTAMTIRGFDAATFREAARLMAAVLREPDRVMAEVASSAHRLALAHPLPPGMLPIRFASGAQAAPRPAGRRRAARPDDHTKQDRSARQG